MMKTNNQLPDMATARKQSKDKIIKHISTFDKLLRQSESRFSLENLYNLLRSVTNYAQADDKDAARQTRRSSFKIRSIRQLSDIAASIKQKTTSSKTLITDEHTLKQSDRFLNDIMHLKDLYKYFNDEIYQCLLANHYDRSVGRDKNVSTKTSHARIGINGADDEDSGVGSQAEAEGDSYYTRRRNKRLGNKSTHAKEMKDSEERYKETVDELRITLKKWKGLLSEDDINLNDFDPESYHELMEFANYSQFEIILRLVPDIFTKCNKCSRCAKVWIKESDIVFANYHRSVLPIVMETPPTPDTKRRETSSSLAYNRETPLSPNNNSSNIGTQRSRNGESLRDKHAGSEISPNGNTGMPLWINGISEDRIVAIRNGETQSMSNSGKEMALSPNNNTRVNTNTGSVEGEMVEIKDQISVIDRTIDEEEKEIANYKHEMDSLLNRDERFNCVSSDFTNMDSRLMAIAAEYHALKTRQITVASRLRSCSNSSPEFSVLKEQSRLIDSTVSQLHWKMKLLEYEKTMVQEDYLVEMELRPSFIRFEGDMKERMEEAQQALQNNKEEKLKLDKQLALLKTNSEGMRKVMDAYLGKEDSTIRTRENMLPSNDSLNGQSSVSTTPSSAEFPELDFELSDVFVEDGNEADTDSLDMSPRVNNRHSRNIYPRQPGVSANDNLLKPRSVMSEKTITINRDTPRRNYRHNSVHAVDYKPASNIVNSKSRRPTSFHTSDTPSSLVNVLARKKSNVRQTNEPRHDRQESNKARSAWET